MVFKIVALEKVAKSLNVNLIHIDMEVGDTKKQWRSPVTRDWVSVEDALLHKCQTAGWRGYSGEGGLILNLIKAMSFPKLSSRHSSVFIEALYSQNVAFEEDIFEVDWMLKNIRKTSARQIKKNFAVMATRKFKDDFRRRRTVNRLEFFPTLEEWMCVEFFRTVGNQTVHDIAKIFATDSYKYRAGWPDVTVWKDGKVRFLEVKSRGDSVHKSQKQVINDIIKPLQLPFALVDVSPAKTAG